MIAFGFFFSFLGGGGGGICKILFSEHGARITFIAFYVVDIRNNSWQYLMLVGRQLIL